MIREPLREAVFRSESKMKILTFLILSFASVGFAADFKAIDGKEYKNVTVSRVEPDGIVLITSSGISKVYFTELPKEVQERFHYDAAKGAAYSSQEAANQQAFQQQQEQLKRQLADEKNRYWIENEARTQSAKKEQVASQQANEQSAYGRRQGTKNRQQSRNIEVLWAHYGRDSKDIDVTVAL